MESISKTFGMQDDCNVVMSLAGRLSFFITEPKQILYYYQGFALTRIEFNEACKHKPEDDWWLVIDPRKKTFHWRDECHKCSKKIQELFIDAGFEEIPESQADEEAELED